MASTDTGDNAVSKRLILAIWWVRVRALLVTILQWTVPTLLAMLLVEGALRVVGYPRGLFSGMGANAPSSTVLATWGPVPFRVRTNQHGLRGPEITEEKPADTKRVVMLGDSYTYGLFVDNEATFPQKMRERLAERGAARHWEVINAGVPGVSLAWERQVLEGVGMKLEPDLVVLQFCTNDISDLRGKSREEITGTEARPWWKVAGKRMATTFVYNTAVGEMLYDLYLRAATKHYRGHERSGGQADWGDERYEVEGGADFAGNVAIEKRRSKGMGGEVSYSPLPPRAEEELANYVYAFDHLERYLRTRNVKLAVLYVPSYLQVYDDSASLELRDRFAAHAAEKNIPFIDFTSTLITEGRDNARVLHMAPLDYHFNPEGNELFGTFVADELLARGLLD